MATTTEQPTTTTETPTTTTPCPADGKVEKIGNSYYIWSNCEKFLTNSYCAAIQEGMNVSSEAMQNLINQIGNLRAQYDQAYEEYNNAPLQSETIPEKHYFAGIMNNLRNQISDLWKQYDAIKDEKSKNDTKFYYDCLGGNGGNVNVFPTKSDVNNNVLKSNQITFTSVFGTLQIPGL